MPKKLMKKSKKEESDDDFEIEEDNNTDIENDEDIDEDYEYENENDIDELNEPELETETNGCFIEEVINNDDEYFENNTDLNLNEHTNIQYIPPNERISCNRLTKYEMVRILGERTKQLTMGAKPLVKKYNNLSYEKIAEEELKLNMIPFKIIRPLPNGKFELWALDELKKDHLTVHLE